jgi:methionine-rich copper-binding protein CopC
MLVTPAMADTTNVALWHMENVPTMSDSSGNGLDGKASSGVTTVPGVNGKGYRFSGTGHVTVANNALLNPGTADFSATVHVKFTAAPSGDYDLIRKGLSSATGGEWKIEILPGGGLVAPAYCLYKDTAGKVGSVRGTSNLNDGAWHTITCAKTASSVKLTVDGATLSKSVTLGSISNSANLVIGQKIGGGDQYAGDMDEVSVDSGTAAGGDPTPPTVTARTPASGSTNVSLTTDVTATFSEPVQNVTTSTFKLKNTATATGVPATVTLDSTKTVATLHPGSPLAAGTKYTATLTAGIQDLAGNALTATSWSFTTGSGSTDTTSPTVTAKSPSAGATNVSTATGVTATFSEPVQNVTTSTFKLKNSATATGVPATVTLDSTQQVATLYPSSPLAAGTKYTATLTTGIKDLAGNSLPSSVSWSFTTGSSTGDSVAPTVTAKSPSAGATNVSTGTDVTVTFSEPVQGVSTSTFKLKNTATSMLVAGTTVTLDSTQKVATLHPGSPLATGTKYVVNLTAGIKDLAGNALTATSWSFTTAP